MRNRSFLSVLALAATLTTSCTEQNSPPKEISIDGTSYSLSIRDDSISLRTTLENGPRSKLYNDRFPFETLDYYGEGPSGEVITQVYQGEEIPEEEISKYNQIYAELKKRKIQ